MCNQSPITLAALPNAAYWARRHVETVLGDWGANTEVASAKLIVTEFMANALKAGGTLTAHQKSTASVPAVFRMSSWRGSAMCGFACRTARDGSRVSFVLRSVSKDETPVGAVREVLSPPVQSPPWVLDAAQLKRGELAELEVELEADPLFRFSMIIASFSDIIQGSDELSSSVDTDGLHKATEMNQLLAKLMGGLVPIRCRILDYLSLKSGGGEYLVHRRVFEQMPRLLRDSMKPVYLVGVAEEDLFWKDIRRVLFSKIRVKVLCRLNYVGLRDYWTRVKLVDVLGEVSPEFARGGGVGLHYAYVNDRAGSDSE